MWSSALFAQVAQEFQMYQDRSVDIALLPIIRYFTEALYRNPLLKHGDLLAYRDYVQGNAPQLKMEETDLPKCNVRAAKVRQEGNELYQESNCREALEKYNESICWARGDSEDIAIAYASRSTIYYEYQEYEFALANISLAKRHKCPERLMSLLEARELACKSKIEGGEHKCSNPCPKLALNVEVNPKIPFVANGIAMKHLPNQGRSMVAERDFAAGDVILHERPMMTSTKPNKKYSVCHYCLSENFMSLIPCPECVSVMYCSEHCLTLGWNVHRFECGICDKLAIFLCDDNMGSKMFFRGLTLFDDHVRMMKKYLKSHDQLESDPFDLNYNDPLEVFKAFHMTKIQPREHGLDNIRRCIAAILFTIYIQQPLVQKLFSKKKEQNFLLKCIFEYSIISSQLSIDRNSDVINQLHMIASASNHSDYPNTHAMYHSGQLKFVVIRPIRKGDQIYIAHGPIWEHTPNPEWHRHLSNMQMNSTCEACAPITYPQWVTKGMRHPPIYHEHLDERRKMLEDKNFSDSDKMDALQRFIQRYGDFQTDISFQQVLNAYRDALTVAFGHEVKFAMREKSLADLN